MLVLSIDDLYLPHHQQVALAESQRDNPLVQHRGQPSTHDIALGTSLFDQLDNRHPDIEIPSYDKSAYNGQGDRVDPSEWAHVNVSDRDIEVVLFEGWCVGFRSCSDQDLESRWNRAKEDATKPTYNGQLGKLSLKHIKFVNDALRDYDRLTDRLDAFIHM